MSAATYTGTRAATNEKPLIAANTNEPTDIAKPTQNAEPIASNRSSCCCVAEILDGHLGSQSRFTVLTSLLNTSGSRTVRGEQPCTKVASGAPAPPPKRPVS